jgi:prepilin-type processing-associated H-X9-DG protein
MSETGPKAKGQKTKITILPIRDKIAVAIVLLFISAILWLVSIHLCEYRRRIKCGEKLSHLGKAMIISAGYCDDKYPVPDKWCDVLVKYAEVTKDEFVCPAAGKSRCDYAMNLDATLTSVPDIVVLFESKPGWNQFGGSELLNFENHDGKGGNVLFNDLHVKFVKTRDLANLIWNPDQINKRHLNITKAKLKSVHTAVMQFKLDTGRFPTEQEGLIALIKLPGDVKNTAEPG